MSLQPSHPSRARAAWTSITNHLNFYRVHLLAFTFTPLVFSGIFYASNGENHISYIDSLFNCVSAMAQAILFIQMCLGSPVVVSWVMVFTRKYYFARKFQHIVTSLAEKKANKDPEGLTTTRTWTNRVASLLHPSKGQGTRQENGHSQKEPPKRKGSIIKKLSPEMIRRMDDAPKPVNPSGWVSEPQSTRPLKVEIPLQQDDSRRLSFAATSQSHEHQPGRAFRRTITVTDDKPSIGRSRRRLSDPGFPSRPSSPITPPMQRFETMAEQHPPASTGFPRTHTIEWAPNIITRRKGRVGQEIFASPIGPAPSEELPGSRRPSLIPPMSASTHMTAPSLPLRGNKHRGFGGFPMPLQILSSLFGRFFPKAKRTLSRTVTVPTATSLVSQSMVHVPAGAKSVPYISFDAVVGRNSAFHWLTSEQLEELGGVEYRALNALLWLVAGYHILTQLISFVVIAPYISTARWADVFRPPLQINTLNPSWFALFQVVSAYTNTGTSLVDQSMVPFQKAYPMIVFMIFLILAGNTCFPIFLRFLIWIITKLVPKTSRMNETLHFLLDHPRRCFVYLFPSHQTWFLLTIVLILSSLDWFFFMILDIGNPIIEAIPLGTRFIDGLLQGVAVRAAGFGIVPLASLAPSVKILYLVMMYISVYPIAMSVRSTNVYEEQSLGVFPSHNDGQLEDAHFNPEGARSVIWSRYLALHARQQLAFDMWWLALALFLLCIVERHMLDDPANFGWFNIFTILFELVSAYGTVGLSLGIPNQDYSLSGAFRPLSKLIVCIVMIRGRHRGLPVAIDRAVLLPHEYDDNFVVEDTDEPQSYRQSYASHPTSNGHSMGPQGEKAAPTN
ncbi:TrkH-domain-containing protein [Pluteus cervinus]|uniref:TrkH-domain-containing protein n=1 Tax=Pluteus cervinus TaxID=181527 RepID=A0ACD3BAE7_9AGAR|nr:TrkH-domain-containing protein [Pluteus cervinus]